MILRVFSNHASFRPVELRRGFNVILAERSREATSLDSTNAVGKSTLLEIIDFCLGASAEAGSGLLIDDLKGWEFSVKLDLLGREVVATRRVDDPRTVMIENHDTNWQLQPELEAKSGSFVYELEQWTTLLGILLVGLPYPERPKYSPTFRSLISYLVRTGDDAYREPLKYFPVQTASDVQVHAAFLLGLAWTMACQWEALSEREKAAQAVKKAVDAGLFPTLQGSLGEMEAERGILQKQVESHRAGLENFRVHPQYEHLQTEADSLSERIHDLMNQVVSDKRKMTLYRKAGMQEAVPDREDVERLWNEVGVIFGDALRKPLDQALEFHRKVVSNRSQFLRQEMRRLEKQIKTNNAEAGQLVNKRAEVMSVLRTHGAVSELAKLQEEHSKLSQHYERLSQQIEEVRRIENEKREVKRQRAELAQALEQDHEARRPRWAKAIEIYAENTRALYPKPGLLVIDVTDRGYSFKVDLAGDDSTGVNKMRLFCFDLTVAELHADEKHWPHLLVHDSTMFDGVDSRQRAHALELAARKCTAFGLQYICTMNSDMVPRKDFSEGFAFDSFVCHTLSDFDPTKSLLGFRFRT